MISNILYFIRKSLLIIKSTQLIILNIKIFFFLNNWEKLKQIYLPQLSFEFPQNNKKLQKKE